MKQPTKDVKTAKNCDDGYVGYDAAHDGDRDVGADLSERCAISK